ncbi:MAG: 16S rRNA (adenine(1518)-N(6)/adenine(1519)-N(6))-dimethyltransferase RsmA [Bacteroidota bacterium]
MSVRAKKHLGQHFLKDKGICKKIAEQYGRHNDCKVALEIGPGMGALTEFLMLDTETEWWLMDVDTESIDYLNVHYPQLEGHIINGDFLKMNPKDFLGDRPFAVIGNFPYNISSQILFRCIEFRNQIPEIMGMFQKEVAMRIAEKPGTKTYGILSVLLQTYYDITYCFTVDEHVFDPPPKVKSGVIRCVRNERTSLPCDEKLYKTVVKMSFNQRRKTIRNSIKALLPANYPENEVLQLRPERLGVEEFIALTCWLEEVTKNAASV